MLIGVGKHKGKSVELIVLKEPSYVKWLLEQRGLTGGLAQVRTEVVRLISIFDLKPIKSGCRGYNCHRPATRFTGYAGNPGLLYSWCDTCDPYQQGAAQGKLTEIKTYADALQHVEWRCTGSKGDYNEIIRAIASFKGLPARCGETQAREFFSSRSALGD